MKKYFTHFLALAILLSACSSSKSKKKPATSATASTSKTATIADKTKNSSKLAGLFPLYQDSTSGNVMMLLHKDQLNKEYIYFSYTVDGVVAAGHFRGSFRDNKVFTIKRYFDKIEFTVMNTGYYFDPSNPISKASKANISDAILSSQKIVAEDAKKGEILIDASALFLSENMQQIKPSSRPGAMGFQLGSLSKDKTKFISLRNYEKNTDVIVEYVYDNPNPVFGGGKEVTDERAVSVVVQHTLIEAPKNDFQPRLDDPRIGYFSEQVEDMTSTNAVAYRDLIHRWNLVKKDTNAAISEPVEPIVWWIENTTPHEFRATIKEAGEKWNLAFEKAGFKNAVIVKEQPDTADWDAGDIRYNVLRWTSSPQPPFGGYGPSFVDPRTGQILGADIMLEYIFVTNRLRQEKLFVASNQNEETDQKFSFKNYCDAHDYLHQSTLFGSQVLDVQGISEVEKREYIKQSLYYLVLHEMGHTMGLNHNMKASQMLLPSQINDQSVTRKIGLTASVMDYPAANVSLDKAKQGDYFTTRPGPYDLWAIEFGYAPSLSDSEKETQRQIALLSKANDPQLIFGNDADDMRGVGSGIDPRVNVNDLTGDAITYSAERIQLSLQLLGKLKEKYSKPNQSYQELRQAYAVVQNEYFQATNVVVKYVGGVYVNRAFVGQPGEGKAYVPVPLAEQKRAMSLLSQYAFSANSYGVQTDLFPYLQMQRRGFNFFGTNEDPKINERVLNYQKVLLAHLTNATVLERLSDSRMYGNDYSVVMMLGDLTNAIFKGDNGKVPTFRFNLQSLYVDRLLMVYKSSNYDGISQAAALAQLKAIEKMSFGGSEESKAHGLLLTQKIRQGLEK
ncbi:MAG: zinc-dependent metalloprotease [Bacteroidia bacterium]|nr:zinc-dependent metalloprotease [Bacteroidia bacterium]MCF8425507.1 zinc-dependent metalloprotease [Bacteroidia bacterium]